MRVARTSCWPAADFLDWKCFADQTPGSQCGIGLCCSDGADCLAPVGTEDYLCLSKNAVGEPCGIPLIGGCVDGAGCVQSDYATPDGTCKPLVGEGEPCGVGFNGCEEGLNCWYDAATGLEATCVKPNAIGEPCAGPGGGGCGDAAACVYTETLLGVSEWVELSVADARCGSFIGDCKAGLVCVRDLGAAEGTCQVAGFLGAECGVSKPACSAGLACTLEIGAATGTCELASQVGDACSFGNPECGFGADCYFNDDSLTSGTCYDKQFVDEPCGIGLGLCDGGTSCVDVDGQFKCVADILPGGACGIGISGNCIAGFVCVGETPESTEGICEPTATVGQACGAGVAGCGAGLDCLVAAAGAAEETAVCTLRQFAGDACGFGIGLCVPGADCLYDDETNTTATCVAQVLEGESCNEANCFGVNECALDAPGSTNATCVAPNLPGSVCGFTFGGCLGNNACVPDTAQATQGICKPFAAAGEACGVGVAACEADLTCTAMGAGQAVCM